MSNKVKHICCIDDEEDIRLLVKLCLEVNQQYKVTCFSSAIEALEALPNILLPDLIILDIMMPQMAGIEAFRELKKRDAFCRIPVVIFTARIKPEEMGEYNALGVSGIITKPFNPQKLAQQIEDILAHAQP